MLRRDFEVDRFFVILVLKNSNTIATPPKTSIIGTSIVATFVTSWEEASMICSLAAITKKLLPSFCDCLYKGKSYNRDNSNSNDCKKNGIDL